MTPRATTAAVAFALLAALASASATAGPVEDMTGYWSGTGTIRLSGKETERVKCVAIYRVGKGGTEIKQTLRCASSDYNINAKADLAIKGGQQVEGSWEEQTYSASGEVTGRYTGSSFVLAIKGANFTAAMNVGLSNCKQSIEITPKGLEMRRISMTLQVLTTPRFSTGSEPIQRADLPQAERWFGYCGELATPDRGSDEEPLGPH